MKKETILLVQDARTQGNSTKRYLENAGHTVVWAGSGMSALVAAGRYAVDLILLDVSLPDIDGIDLCQRFRSRRDTHTIPIILFTAHELPEGTFRRKADGPDDYLTKPFTEGQLSAKIAVILEARAAALEAERKQREDQQPTEGQEGQTEQKQPDEQPARRPEQPSTPPPKPDIPSEPVRSLIPGPRSSLKPKPELEATPPAESALPPPKPALRLVPKPKPAAAAAVTPDPPAAVAEERAQSPIAPLTPPFAGSPDEVIDPSTGLFSRPQFEAMFSKEFKRAVRFKQQMSCMLIDLDGSAMGREADGALVKALIGVVQRTIREVDTAAWWTGGSLIVLLPNTMRNDAVQAAMRVLEAVAVHPFTWPDATQVTVNIGVAGLPDRKIDSEQKMLEAAATACRRARQTLLPSSQSSEKGKEP